MPTLLETASILDKMLKEGWQDQTPIAVDNIPYEDVQGTPYLSTQFIPYNTNNEVLGSHLTCKRKRTTGVLSILIRTPFESGIGLAYTYSESIGEIMDNKNPVCDLFTLASATRRVGDSGDGWFNLMCDVPFVSDNT